MNTSDTLNLAADLIEQRGWTTGVRGMLATEAGPVCVEGAISAVLGLPIVEAFYGRGFAYPDSDCPAYVAVANYLELCDGDRIFDWNDMRADAASAVEVLRACAVIEASRERETAEVTSC